MTGARICLITPGHLSTNPRLIKEACSLSDAGHQVHIVCGRFLANWREFDAAVTDARWRISYVAFGRFEARRFHLFQKAKQYAARMLVRLGIDNAWLVATAHSPASPGLLDAALHVSADLYIAHYVAALPAAARAANKHGAIFAFDAEDFHVGDLPDEERFDFEKRLIADIECRYLPAAAYVTAAAPMIADAYRERYGLVRPTVVLNVFPAGNGPATPSSCGSVGPRPAIYWFSQTIGAGRGIETAIEAIARAASAPHLYLRGTPAPGYERALRSLAATHGVEQRLHFLAPVAPQSMEHLGSQYDVGYVGELAETQNRQIAITNKLFSYLCSGLAVVASDIPSHRELAVQLGDAMTLFASGSAKTLADAFDRVLLDHTRLAAARGHAWRLARERYCWEVEREVLLKQIAITLASAPQWKPSAQTHGHREAPRPNERSTPDRPRKP